MTDGRSGVGATRHTARRTNAGFVFTVSKTGTAASVSTSSLNLQVKFPRFNLWAPSNDCLVDQNPSQSFLAQGAQYGYSPYCHDSVQSASLNAATLGDRFPTAALGSGAPFFGRTGIQQVIHWFGYRFCYSSSGGWRCGSNNCPSAACSDLTQTAWPATDQFAQHCMRAGVELAVRKAGLGSNLGPARDAAVNALKGAGSPDHKCIAAVAGAVLWLGAASTAAFTGEVQSAANAVPSGCQSAASRILGGSALNCASYSSHYEKSACAAAEGLRGNDAPVKSVLMAFSGDGNQGGEGGTGDYPSLYWGYMLAIVTAQRTAANGSVSYYPDAGAPLVRDGAPPLPDSKPPTPDTKPPPKPDAPKPPIDAAPKKDTVKPPTIDAAVKKDTAKPPTVDGAKQDVRAQDGVPALDAPGPAAESGTAPDATVPKREPSTLGPSSLDGGCGCSLDRAPGSALPPGLLLLAWLALVVLRRRR